MNLNQQYSILVQSLKLAAHNPETQISLLPSFVVVTDEIALTFEDGFLLATELKENNYISDSIFKYLVELDNLFNNMSNDKSIWSIEALINHYLWQQTRELAKLILNEMNETLDLVVLQNVTYIENN